MDRHYYKTHDLRIAQHPSETNLRLMIRLIVFALNASENLSFTKGLSTDDEPTLWKKSLGDEIELWIDLGQPENKRIRKACGRAQQVIIYTYNQRKAKVWIEQQNNNLQRFKNLKIVQINAENVEGLLQRNMELQCNIQEGEMMLIGTELEVNVSWQSRLW